MENSSAIRRRKFIDNWKDSLRSSDFYVPEDSKKKGLVLTATAAAKPIHKVDAEFRRTELCMDRRSGELAAPDDIKFKFKFLD